MGMMKSRQAAAILLAVLAPVVFSAEPEVVRPAQPPPRTATELNASIKNLDPAEQRAAIRVWRESQLKSLRPASPPSPWPGQTPPAGSAVSPGERASLLQRVEVLRTELQSKKTEGRITPLEEAQLEKLDHFIRLGRHTLPRREADTNTPPAKVPADSGAGRPAGAPAAAPVAPATP
jgi:hypothetical protein